MNINTELMALINDIAGRVDRWTGGESWTFGDNSAAHVEVSNAELRSDGTPWGDRPVRTTYQFAQMATKLTIELSRCTALLIGVGRPAPGIEVEARSALEAGSVAWWLLEPELTARQRVCRMYLLRRNNARELARSIAQVGANPEMAGTETVANVEAEALALGLSPFTRSSPRVRALDKLEDQVRPSYTVRVKSLTDDLGNMGAYSIYSSVAHAELAGIWRLLGHRASDRQSRDPIYGVVTNPAASFAAAHSVLKAMMGPVERIALLFNWTVPGRGDEISATIEYLNERMAQLHLQQDDHDFPPRRTR